MTAHILIYASVAGPCLVTYFLDRPGSLAQGSHAGEMFSMVCGTCCQGAELSHESMDGHDPNGPTLCIHSVVVAESHRRKGYATTMLKVQAVDSLGCTEPKSIIPLFCVPFVEKNAWYSARGKQRNENSYVPRGTRC